MLNYNSSELIDIGMFSMPWLESVMETWESARCKMDPMKPSLINYVLIIQGNAEWL